MATIQELRDRITGKARLHESYQAVFNTPDGERVLRHLMRVGHVLTPTFVKGDAHMTAFNEGARHLALSILKFVHRDHGELLRAIEEGINEDTAL